MIVKFHQNLNSLFQNGTGKTGAYSVPLLEQIDTTKDVIQVSLCSKTQTLSTNYYRPGYDRGPHQGARPSDIADRHRAVQASRHQGHGHHR